MQLFFILGCPCHPLDLPDDKIHRCRLEDLPETKMSPTEKRKQINFYKTKKEEILEQTIKFRLKAGM
jgi:hypothetical protein